MAANIKISHKCHPIVHQKKTSRAESIRQDIRKEVEDTSNELKPVLRQKQVTQATGVQVLNSIAKRKLN